MTIMATSNERNAKIDEAFEHEKWQKARRLLKTALQQSPNDHWLITRLGMTYYEEKDYKKAKELSEKAVHLKPTCPLANWDYACALDMLEETDEAIQVWKRIIERGVDDIANDECGEGIQWARSLVNDSCYRLGLAYRDKGNLGQAVTWIKMHLNRRGPGVFSLYKKNDVVRQLRCLECEEPQQLARLQALSELTAQAQELQMGYEDEDN